MRLMRLVVSLLVLAGATRSVVRPACGTSSARPELVLQLGHTEAVGFVAYSRDGSRLVTGSEDRTVRIWDPRSGELVRKLPGDVGGRARSPSRRTGGRSP